MLLMEDIGLNFFYNCEAKTKTLNENKWIYMLAKK